MLPISGKDSSGKDPLADILDRVAKAKVDDDDKADDDKADDDGADDDGAMGGGMGLEMTPSVNQQPAKEDSSKKIVPAYSLAEKLAAGPLTSAHIQHLGELARKKKAAELKAKLELEAKNKPVLNKPVFHLPLKSENLPEPAPIRPTPSQTQKPRTGERRGISM